MATNGKTPRDLPAVRINRLEKQGAETNKRLNETNQRLDQVVSVLQHVVQILDRQGTELERHGQLLEQHTKLLQGLNDRLERFADMVILGRTRDTEKIGELEQRVE